MVVVAAVEDSADEYQVVEQAAVLAERFDEPLHVVHVMTQLDFVERQRDRAERTGRPIEISEIKETAGKEAQSVAEEANVDAYKPVGLMGDPASQIVLYARQEEARYIVIGGRRRSGLGGAVFGRPGQKILRRSDKPVLTVKAKRSKE